MVRCKAVTCPPRRRKPMERRKPEKLKEEF